MFFSYSSSMKSQSCPTIKRWDLVVVMCWMLGTISINSSFCRPLDNWVQGIIESLHRQFHHLFQGVVVCAFILVAHRLKRGEEVGSKIKHQMHTPLPCIDQLTAAHPRFQTNVNRLPIYCHRDGFTITEVHAFDSKHVPEINKDTKMQSAMFEARKIESWHFDIAIILVGVYTMLCHRFMAELTATWPLFGFGRPPCPSWHSGSPWLWMGQKMINDFMEFCCHTSKLLFTHK